MPARRSGSCSKRARTARAISWLRPPLARPPEGHRGLASAEEAGRGRQGQARIPDVLRHGHEEAARLPGFAFEARGEGQSGVAQLLGLGLGGQDRLVVAADDEVVDALEEGVPRLGSLREPSVAARLQHAPGARGNAVERLVALQDGEGVPRSESGPGP